MSSILTNNGAMVALQTLKSINSNLGKVQSEIATGKSVASAKDNAAVWAISKTMEADVAGFTAISDSLNLGEQTVAVGRKAAESVADLLNKMTKTIVNGQNENLPRDKLQDNVVAIRDQIASIVGAAQLNGLNLVDGSQTTVNVLSSLDRNATGVTSSNIAVTAQDLSIGTYAFKSAFTAGTGTTNQRDAQAFNLDAGGNDTITIDAAAGFAEGDRISVRIGDKEASYTVTAADAASTTPSDIVAVGLKSAIEALGVADLTVDYDSGNAGQLTLNNNGARDLAVSAQFKNAGAGGLGALDSIDVSTAAGAAAALASIESLRDVAIDAAAAFGSVEGRIQTQADFVSGLSNSLKSGIGGLVDADMEEASARLQALQVQQQLGVQALSIANQAPQSLLSLFR